MTTPAYAPPLVVEDMHEGWLVKGTLDPEAALQAAADYLGVEPAALLAADARLEPGRYRKMPSQWGSWRLHEATGRGSFEATIVRCWKRPEAPWRQGVAGR